MKLSSFLAIPALVVGLSGTASAATAKWQVDPAHTRIEFSVRHMMVSNVRGHFGTFSGTAHYDDKDLAQSKVSFTVDVDTIDTANAKRDEHLRSPDFFDAKKYPKITFTSTQVKRGKKGAQIVGNLTLRGVTREVTFDVEGPTPPVKSPWGKMLVGAQASTTINRKDFGLTWNKVLETGGLVVGDEVKITVDIELTRSVGSKS